MATAGQPVPPLVGVFQDAPLADVIDAANRVGFAAIQLHGSEDADYVAALRGAFDGEIWLAENAEGVRRAGGDRILYDNGKGGTGATFDWTAIADRSELADDLVAGGIGMHNAREAARLGAHAIDVGSATDASPGTKDHAKFAALFDALRPISRKERKQECA